MTHVTIQEKVAALFGTEFMRGVVLRQYEQLDAETVLDIVAGAPVPLTRKLELLTELADEDERFCQAREGAATAVERSRQGRVEGRVVRAYRLVGRHATWEDDPFVRYGSFREAIRKTKGEAARSRAHDWYQLDEVSGRARWGACAWTRYWLDPCGEPVYFEFDRRLAEEGDPRPIPAPWDKRLSIRSHMRRVYDGLLLPIEADDVIETAGLPGEPRARATVCEVGEPGRASLLSVQVRWHSGKPPWPVPLFCGLDSWPPAYPVSPLYGLAKVTAGETG